MQKEKQELALPESAPLSKLDAPFMGVFPFSWEVALFILLMIAAATMRFWDLGSRALHHDESLHALYSWYLYVGQGYRHDPMMHGPFQFHANALIYFLFGDSDYTARVLPALFGTTLVGLPYFLRRYLGRLGALVIAVLLTFSPSMLYFSRFVRNDIYIAFWSLALVIFLWRYLSERKAIYLYLGAAVLSLSFCTKEVTYITVAIFGSFLFIVAAWDVLARLIRKASQYHISAPAAFFLLIATLTFPQLSAGSTIIIKFFHYEIADIASKALIVVTFVVISAIVGLIWDTRRWLISAAIFYGIFAFLYTTFFTHPPGFASGIWGSLDYWLAQQGVQRGGQPWYYYFVLLPIYEFLPLIFAIIAALYYTVRGDLFSRFLVWWTVGAFAIYSFAGEKMPWLVLHMALPLILLGGKFIGQVLEGVDWRAVRDKGGLYFALSLPLILLALSAVFEDTTILWKVGLLVVVALLAAVVLDMGWRLGLRLSLRLLALVSSIILLFFTVRAAWQASYYHGDIPVEMLVYTQTSPDVPKIMADIERLSYQTGEGKNLRITVDATSGFTWPWAWYLRDYKNVEYPGLETMSSAPKGSVLLLHVNNKYRAEPYLAKYGPGRQFPHRWWFPEDYRGLTLRSLIHTLSSRQSWRKGWQYFVYRELGKPLGSEDGIVYFPKDFIPTGTTLSQAEPPLAEEPEKVDVVSELSFGGKGKTPGYFDGPKGIAIDGGGNIYVADSLNHRIQKFDANGKFLAQIGRQGTGEGEFNEPWGIAVDNLGNVYVADTWNHRVQKFDSNLRFVSQWGQFLDTGGVAEGNGGKFYGPRDIAIDVAGNLYITDTGNKRVQKFAPDGTFLAAFGGAGKAEGKFSEPVGIAIDNQGDIYVADTWNRRIQRFDSQFRFRDQYPVAGWESETILNKPYLAIDPAGIILVTDPEGNRLLSFSSSGSFLSATGSYGTGAGSFSLPIGIEIDSAGRIYIAEAGNNRVQRLAAIR